MARRRAMVGMLQSRDITRGPLSVSEKSGIKSFCKKLKDGGFGAVYIDLEGTLALKRYHDGDTYSYSLIDRPALDYLLRKLHKNGVKAIITSAYAQNAQEIRSVFESRFLLGEYNGGENIEFLTSEGIGRAENIWREIAKDHCRRERKSLVINDAMDAQRKIEEGMQGFLASRGAPPIETFQGSARTEGVQGGALLSLRDYANNRIEIENFVAEGGGLTRRVIATMARDKFQRRPNLIARIRSVFRRRSRTLGTYIDEERVEMPPNRWAPQGAWGEGAGGITSEGEALPALSPRHTENRRADGTLVDTTTGEDIFGTVTPHLRPRSDASSVVLPGAVEGGTEAGNSPPGYSDQDESRRDAVLGRTGLGMVTTSQISVAESPPPWAPPVPPRQSRRLPIGVSINPEAMHPINSRSGESPQIYTPSRGPGIRARALRPVSIPLSSRPTEPVPRPAQPPRETRRTPPPPAQQIRGISLREHNRDRHTEQVTIGQDRIIPRPLEGSSTPPSPSPANTQRQQDFWFNNPFAPDIAEPQR